MVSKKHSLFCLFSHRDLSSPFSVLSPIWQILLVAGLSAMSSSAVCCVWGVGPESMLHT